MHLRPFAATRRLISRYLLGMPTQKQSAAGKGKAASQTNALKARIDATSPIIPGEEPAEREALKAEYLASFRPTTPEQRQLIDVLIDAEWRLRRFRMIEAEIWSDGVESVKEPNKSVALALAFKKNMDLFDRLSRRVDIAIRDSDNARRELKRSQTVYRPVANRETVLHWIH